MPASKSTPSDTNLLLKWIVDSINAIRDDQKEIRSELKDIRSEFKEELKELRSEMKDIRIEVRDTRKKVDEVWDYRKEVQVKYTRGLILQNLGVHAAVSAVVTLAILGSAGMLFTWIY